MEHVRQELAQLTTAREVVQAVLSQIEKFKIRCVVLLWVWWDTRNKVNAGEPLRSIESVCNRIQQQINDCELLIEAKENKHTQVAQNWTPPSEDTLKINVDGSARADNSNGGWGFIIRDHMGDAIAAGAGNLPHFMNPLHTVAH